MAEEFYSLVTDYGAEKQLKCLQEGTPFDVYQIALGDGNGRYYEPTTDQTKLVKEVCPVIFDNAGPGGVKGGCPEGKMTCGKAKEIREKFKNL